MADDKAVNYMFTCERILDLLPEPFKGVLSPFAIDEQQINAKHA
jgi:hypothetical protein